MMSWPPCCRGVRAWQSRRWLSLFVGFGFGFGLDAKLLQPGKGSWLIETAFFDDGGGFTDHAVRHHGKG